MSFILHRTQKYANLIQHADGNHIVRIENVTVVNATKFIVEYKFQDRTVLKNTYIYNPEKYGPFDALIDAAIGDATGDIDLQDLVGKYVEIHVRNEEKNGRIYTNIKRVNATKELDISEIIDDEETEPGLDDEEYNSEEDDDDDLY